MTIKGSSEPKEPESIGQVTGLPKEKEVSKLEEGTREVGEKALSQGVLPEKFSPLLTHNFQQLHSPLPTGQDPQVLMNVVGSIMAREGISSQPVIGAQAVALQGLLGFMNRPFKASGYDAPFSQFEEHRIDTKEFPDATVIFNAAGVTITGIDENRLGAFLEEVKKTNPDLYTRMSAYHEEGKLAVVSKDEVAKIEAWAEDKFSQIATELRDTVSKPQEPNELKEEIEEEIEEESEEKLEESKKLSEEGSHIRGLPVTTCSIEAAETNEVATRILLNIVKHGQQTSERASQEKGIQKRQEQEEIRKDELKKQEKRKTILKEDIEHYRQEAEVEKRAAKTSILSEKSVAHEKGEQESYLTIAEYEALKKKGAPTPPPSSQRSQ